jgi:hypothetical protein
MKSVQAFVVGYCTVRPPTAANTKFTYVLTDEPTEREGELLALQMVASRENVVMPLSIARAEVEGFEPPRA